MQLTVNGDTIIEDATAADIERGVAALTPQAEGFIILAEDDMTYMQAAGDVEKGFWVEYQAGSLDAHYSAGGGHDAALLVQLLSSYLAGDEAWRQWVRWS